MLRTTQQHAGWIGGRCATSNDGWLSPRRLIEALGSFDLDPCAPAVRPWATAKHHYTILDNGLAQPWRGRVWLNPPYGSQTGLWLRKLRHHGNGIALVFARTGAKWFFRSVWNGADAVFFLRGRLQFYNLDGSPAPSSAATPSCLVAYGHHNVQALQSIGVPGKLILLRNVTGPLGATARIWRTKQQTT